MAEEISEEGVRLTNVPVVMIADKPLLECSPAELEQAYSRLLRRLTEQRTLVSELRKQNTALQAALDAARAEMGERP
jgi:hypothetical protein